MMTCWGQASARGRTWACLLLLVHLGAQLCAYAQDQPTTVVVTDGQGLADQLAVFGASGADMVIEVAPPPGTLLISMQNVTFPDFSQLPKGSFTSGTATVRGRKGQSVVIDTAMRVLTPVLSGSAHLVLEDLTLINLCEAVNNYTTVYSNRTGTFWTALALFPRTLFYQSETYINFTTYAPYADVVTSSYLFTMQASPISKVREVAGLFVRAYPPAKAQVSAITPTMLRASYYSIPSVVGINHTLKVISDATDPLLQQARALGLLPSQQYCNSVNAPYLVPRRPVPITYGVAPDIGPMFVTNTSSAAASGLQQAAQLTASIPRPILGPPIVMLLADVSLTPEALPAPAKVSSPVLLVGPMLSNSMSNSTDTQLLPRTTLDLQSRTGLLQLQPGGLLIMQQLILTGLAQAPLPAVTGSNTATGNTMSALHLAAISTSAGQDTWATNASIWLHECELQLPADDFLAMVMLAAQSSTGSSMSGCVDGATAAHAASLGAGIISLQTAGFNTSSPLRMVLSNLTGWGIAATQLHLTIVGADAAGAGGNGEAQAAAARCLMAAALNNSTSSSSNGGSQKLSSRALAGVVVGSVVGASLVAAAAAMLLLRRRTRQRKQQLEKAALGGAATKENSPGSQPNTDADLAVSIKPMAAGAAREAHSSSQPASSTLPCPGTDTVGSLLHHMVQQAEDEQASHLLLSTANKQQQQPSLPSSLPADSTETATTTSAASSSRRFGGPAAVADAAAVVIDSEAAAASSHPGTLASFFTCDSSGWQDTVASHQHPPSDQKGDQQAPRNADMWQQQQLASPAGARDRTWPALPPTHLTLNLTPGWSPAAAAATSSSSQQPQQLRHEFSQLVQSKAAALQQDDGNKVTVRGVLGVGGCGTVYVGEWRGLPVAIKTMVFELPVGTATVLPRPSQQQQQQQEVEAGTTSAPTLASPQVPAIMEAAIAASVGHRNLVCTYCYDFKRVQTHHTGSGGLQIEEAFHPEQQEQHEQGHQAEGATSKTSVPKGMATYKLFLVQELCGVPLFRALSEQALCDPATGMADQGVVVQLLLDIAHGLHYLHEHHIIHGDLKPANVLLKSDHTRKQLPVCAKLADFGLSSYLHEGATHVSNFAGGTPFYVAPEVIQQRRTSPASDIYSFGVLMWQMFRGETPYQKKEDGGFGWHPEFGRHSPTRMPHLQYVQLQSRCLQHDPSLRPTAQQLIIELSQLMLQGGRTQ